MKEFRAFALAALALALCVCVSEAGYGNSGVTFSARLGAPSCGAGGCGSYVPPAQFGAPLNYGAGGCGSQQGFSAPLNYGAGFSAPVVRYGTGFSRQQFFRAPVYATAPVVVSRRPAVLLHVGRFGLAVR